MRVLSLCSKTLAVAIPLMMLFSCQKGNTGPAGPAGPTGPTGAAGATGTANVIYSDWFTPTVYTKDTVFGIYGFYYNKAAASITQKIIDSGTVIVFGKLLGYNTAIWPTTQTSQLPISLTYIQGVTMTDTWSALTTAGNLKIQFVNDDNYYGSISTAHQFRYVVIPGGVKTTSAVKQGAVSGSGSQISSADLAAVAQNYQQMSYAEVCQRLGIPE